MTPGEAAIFFALIGSIIAFLYKAIRENTNADAFRKILNKITLTQQIHASKIRRHDDNHETLRRRVDNHDEEFENVRSQIRDITPPSTGGI